MKQALIRSIAAVLVAVCLAQAASAAPQQIDWIELVPAEDRATRTTATTPGIRAGTPRRGPCAPASRHSWSECVRRTPYCRCNAL